MAKKGVLPRRYRRDFLIDISRKTPLARRLTENLQGLESDLGGPDNLSTAQRTLCERCTWLVEILRQQESRMAQGLPIDLGSYTRATQTLTTILKTLGLRRVARNVPTLHAYIASKTVVSE